MRTLLAWISIAGCTADTATERDPSPESVPNGLRPEVVTEDRTELQITQEELIRYHGGPVMTDANVYLIWYGNWTNDSAVTILNDFVGNLPYSTYWQTNSTYYDSSGAHVTLQSPHLIRYWCSDNYSQGTNITNFSTVLQHAVDSCLPKDANGIYVVLTSPDVTWSSFCTYSCGYHYYASVEGYQLKYAVIGNAATQCPGSCGVRSPSPNGNPGADAMVGVVAHEIQEAVTDPLVSAWYDANGYETADKCAWTFGSTYKTSNGADANLHLNTRDYLVQQNWVNDKYGYCAMSNEHRLGLHVRISGTEPITFYPGGGTCLGPTCYGSYAPNTNIALFADAAGGHSFCGWSGCDWVSGNECGIGLTSDRTATATYSNETCFVMTCGCHRPLYGITSCNGACTPTSTCADVCGL